MKRAVIRLPPAVVDRLDELAHKLRAEHPGRGCSRASLVRALITSGLAVAEAEREAITSARLHAAAGASAPATETAP